MLVVPLAVYSHFFPSRVKYILLLLLLLLLLLMSSVINKSKTMETVCDLVFTTNLNSKGAGL